MPSSAARAEATQFLAHATDRARHELTEAATIEHVQVGLQRAAGAGDDIATRHGESVARQSLHDRSAETAAGARHDSHRLVHMTSPVGQQPTLADGDSPR